MASSVHLRRPASLDSLPEIALRTNWKIPPLRLPHLMVRRWGANLDLVATELLEDIGKAGIAGIRVGTALESRTVPGVQRTLRIENWLQAGHRVATDITFRAQGDDLYLRFDTRARTRIAWLRSGLRAAAVLGVSWLGYALLIDHTQVYNAMASEFARKYWSDFHLGLEAIRGADWVDQTTGRVIAGRAWGWMDFLKQDPKLFLANLGMTPVAIGAIVGVAMRWMPPNALRHPCRWLGWPTPDEFHNAAVGHHGWVHGRLSSLLFNHFRLSGADVIHLQDVQSS